MQKHHRSCTTGSGSSLSLSSSLLRFSLLATVLTASAAGCTGSISSGATSAGDDDAPGTPPLNPPVNPTPPPDAGAWGEHVTLRLNKLVAGDTTVSFGLPVPPGIGLTDVRTVRVTVAGGAVIAGAQVREILAEQNETGARTGVRALQIQLPAAAMPGNTLDVDVAWTGGTTASDTFATFNEISADSAASVEVADRTISNEGGQAHFVELSRTTRTLYVGREARVIATFPDGYLAQTRILGQLTPASKLNTTPAHAGLAFYGTALRDFAKSAMYRETYALNPDPDSVMDPVTNYEGWLYDRCSTWLISYSVVGDVDFLREGLRACSYYARQIDANGIFLGKPDADPKYSHLRGLYAYYAITGDEEALRAGTAIADMWHNDQLFVAPYADGHTRGPDKLWTERLLGTSLEGLYYGTRLTGDTKYLTRFKAMLDTAYRHLTGDAATLALINPDITVQFPPQNCFVHTGEQQSDAGATDPWCSMWMSELAVDVLLRWQEQSGDPRVDEMFVRLTRAMRDFATSYFHGDILHDSFLEPSQCASEDRILVPLYGAGLDSDGTRQSYGDYTDFEHCADASALSAAGIRALSRQGRMNDPGVGPFATESASFLALHQELANCARDTFKYYDRGARDPSAWTASQLEDGVADPATFIADNRIGFPHFGTAPQRKFSWWFNMSMLQHGLLEDAGISLPSIKIGQVQPASCKK